VAEETYYRAAVRARTWLTPHLVRLRLGAPDHPAAGPTSDLTHFRSTGVPDERVVLVLPEGHRRSYSVRAFDPATSALIVDVAAHTGGVAATWAREAQPGDVLLVSEPLGWYAPPSDAGWQLLVGDLTALPAVGRITEATGLPTHTLVEVPDAADRLPLPPGTDAHWLCGSGNGRGPSALPSALRDVAWPAGPGYVWCAGEAAAARAVRRHLRHDLGWSVDRYRVLGYWRVDQEAWQRRYAPVGRDLEGVYRDAVASGLSSTDALEAYDDALEQVGL
jgi:NADPH-dependent ferric siderophore reductase